MSLRKKGGGGDGRTCAVPDFLGWLLLVEEEEEDEEEVANAEGPVLETFGLLSAVLASAGKASSCSFLFFRGELVGESPSMLRLVSQSAKELSMLVPRSCRKAGFENSGPGSIVVCLAEKSMGDVWSIAVC